MLQKERCGKWMLSDVMAAILLLCTFIGDIMKDDTIDDGESRWLVIDVLSSRSRVSVTVDSATVITFETPFIIISVQMMI